jgi:hypothetical protein
MTKIGFGSPCLPIGVWYPDPKRHGCKKLVPVSPMKIDWRRTGRMAE